MSAPIRHIDAHEPPSDTLKAIWKRLTKIDQDALLASGELDDIQSPLDAGFLQAGVIPAQRIAAAFGGISRGRCVGPGVGADARVYSHPVLPGLLFVPSLLPPEVQMILLDKMLHRDLSHRAHLTNLHPHYNLPRPFSYDNDDDIGDNDDNDDDDNDNDDDNDDDHDNVNDELSGSYFSYPPDSPVRFSPKDSSVHKPLSIRQALDKKLHWITLGGQYDWTSRAYPDAAKAGAAPPPAFPSDLARFLGELFPDTVAQAAIVNVYGAGDTMSMHRDVSEETDRGLISLSFGCDGLFLICRRDPGSDQNGDADADRDADAGADADSDADGKGHERRVRGDKNTNRKKQYLLLRLRSGDVVYMTGESRCAWHGVPRMLTGTCPDYLSDWPAGRLADPGRFGGWRGWMRNKRINFNVRQMRE